MAGYGLSKKYHLSSILENNLIDKGHKVKVVNAGVSGDTSAGGSRFSKMQHNVMGDVKTTYFFCACTRVSRTNVPRCGDAQGAHL